MSLLDGLLEDALLETVVRSEVYIALRSDFKDDPNRLGAGTAEDPYDGSKTSGGVYKLDAILRTKVGANTTVYLGPGIYYTQGFKGTGAGTGFWVRSGWRIVGGGWARATGTPTQGNTVLVLEGHTASSENHAFGCGTAAGEEADGFELAYVSINAGLPATGSWAAGGINVNGKHIRIHHVRIFGFGSRTTPCNVLLAARTTVNQPDAQDNVISDCVIENPSANSTGTVICISLSSSPDSSTPYYHIACVVRGNFIDCGTSGLTYDYRGIGAGGGRGMILEENRIWNCQSGLRQEAPGTWLSLDIIARDNIFYNVLNGVLLTVGVISPPQWTVGRVVLQSNRIELAASGSPIGIKLDGQSSTTYLFKQVIIRLNEIRHNDGATGPSGTIGITLDSIAEAIVEENLISIGTDPANPDNQKAVLRNSSVAKMKTFNNESTAGVFLGCWNSSATMHDGDLVTDIEAAVMAL